MTNYYTTLSLHRNPASSPAPRTRPTSMGPGGSAIGKASISDALGGETVSEEIPRSSFEQIIPVETVYENATHLDFDTDFDSSDPLMSNQLIYPLIADTITTSSYTGREEISTTLSEPGRTHRTWIKTWVSPPFATAATLSSTNSGFSYKGFHCYGSSETISAYPAVCIYLWASNDSNRGFLYDGTSSVTIPWYDPLGTSSPWTNSLKEYWTNENFTASITASAGDRLCFELTQVEDPELDIATHLFAFDKEYMSDGLPYFSVFSTKSVISFSTFINKKLSTPYAIKNILSYSVNITYSVDGVIEKTMESFYNIAPLEPGFELNITTPLRGHASLRIRPDFSFLGASPRFTDVFMKRKTYEARFPTKMASLNRFEMLDDFESYESTQDLIDSGGWYFYYDTGSIPYMTARKTFEAYKNLEDFNLISVLGKASQPSSLELFLVDSNDRTSSMNTILIDSKSGRYECELDMKGCYPSQISSLILRVKNSGTMSIDDIVVLKQEESRKYYDWTPILLENVSLEKQSKVSTIKIPYKAGETVQYHGEYSANGSFLMRTFDNRENFFLTEAERDNIPLYLRAKQFGIPMELSAHDTTFAHYGVDNVKTIINVSFREIYNSEV